MGVFHKMKKIHLKVPEVVDFCILFSDLRTKPESSARNTVCLTQLAVSLLLNGKVLILLSESCFRVLTLFM